MNRTNLCEVCDYVGICPLRIVLLLLVLPCDTGEKAVLAIFPQFGGKMAGENLDEYGAEARVQVFEAG